MEAGSILPAFTDAATAVASVTATVIYAAVTAAVTITNGVVAANSADATDVTITADLATAASTIYALNQSSH